MTTGPNAPPTFKDERETDTTRQAEPSDRPRKPPTIRDVAAAAGVSRATVSRVLNGGKWVSPKAAEAVEEAMARIQYVASHSARSLNTRRSGAVALVITEQRDHLFEDPTLSTLVQELTTRLAEHKSALYVTLATDDASRKRAVHQVRSGLLDGLILVSTREDDPMAQMLVAANVPAIACAEPLGLGSELPHVTVNDRAGAAAMTEYLLARGRRRIGVLTGPLAEALARNRLAGYRDALGDDFSDRLVVECPAYSAHAAEVGMRGLLERVPYIDAVFAASDLLASGALAALDRAGRRIPDDIALGGFDDSTLAAISTPPLTTMHVPFDKIAEAAVNQIVARLEGERPEPVELTCTLVERMSA